MLCFRCHTPCSWRRGAPEGSWCRWRSCSWQPVPSSCQCRQQDAGRSRWQNVFLTLPLSFTVWVLRIADHCYLWRLPERPSDPRGAVQSLCDAFAGAHGAHGVLWRLPGLHGDTWNIPPRPCELHGLWATRWPPPHSPPESNSPSLFHSQLEVKTKVRESLNSSVDEITL